MKTTTKKVIINFLLIYIGSLIILYFIFKYGLRRQFFEWIMFQCQNNKPILGFIVMLFPLLGIILGYKLSFKKNRNDIFWSILCFFSNIWGVIILWLLPDLDEEKKVSLKKSLS